VRRRHPVLRGRADGPLDLKTYLGQSHLQVSLRGEPAGYVDAVLARAGHRRRVVLTVGHFLLAPSIVAASDLVATEPARLIEPEARRHGLVLRPPPFALPDFDVTQIWPRRLAGDPAHAWLRTLVAEAASKPRV
jgi:DNA-binding transcriptional LysR family regulator